MSIDRKAENKIVRRLFLKSEVSWGISDLSKAIGPMIDLVFISNFIGVNGVTVLGFITPLTMFFEVIGSAVANGARIMVSSMIGAGKLGDANRVFSDSLIMSGGLSLLLALLSLIFCPGLTMILGANEAEIVKMTQQYVYGYVIGFPFYTLTRVITPYLQIEGQYKRVNLTSILTTAIDIAGDAFVIFGMHGGMFEIGLATSVGYIIPFFVSATYFINKKKSSVFQLRFKGFSPKLCLEMFRLGAPMGITKGSKALGGLLLNNMLTAFSMPYLVAAHGVFSQITVFLRAAWYAPADTLMAFTGVFIGEEDRDSIKLTQKISLIHSLIMTSIVTVLLYAYCNPLASVFLRSDNPQALILARECIRVACLSLPLHAFVYNFDNYLMGIKKLIHANIYSFLIECGNLVPITLLSLRIIGYEGAWISKISNMAGLTLIALIYILANKEGDTFSDKMLLLPRSFGTTPENEISITATTVKDIEYLSYIAIAFANEHAASKKRARNYGLIVEELSIYFAEHGFKDGAQHYINARLVAKDDDLIIRMRDDCKLLNLKEYYQLIKEDQSKMEEGINLAIILKMAKDVKYTSTFGANTLIIKL